MKYCIVLAAFLALPVRAHADDAAAEDYRLVEASGEVAVIPAGSDQPLKADAGLPLSAGDRIVTGAGGTAELATKSGTVIHLDNNTSLGLDDLRSGWTQFRLYIGRFLGRFEHTEKSRYSVKTPVAVASVRGTEFALDVSEEGALDAGVVNGEVAFEPASETGTEAPSSEQPAWTPEVLTASQGLSVHPLERPRRLSEIPRPLVRSMDWFPRVRDRLPKLRDEWKDLDVPSRMKMRQQALRERVQWHVPERARERMSAPRERVRPRPVERRRLERPGPKRP